MPPMVFLLKTATQVVFASLFHAITQSFVSPGLRLSSHLEYLAIKAAASHEQNILASKPPINGLSVIFQTQQKLHPLVF